MPGEVKLEGLDILWNPIAGPCTTGMVIVEFADTSIPSGAVPVAVLVLVIDPWSTSAWVVTYVAKQLSLAPGANVVTGHVTIEIPGSGSTTTMLLNVTLPVLVTRPVNVIVVPDDVKLDTFAVFTKEIPAEETAGTLTVEAALTTVPTGSVAFADPVFVTEPRSTSACVVTYVAVHVPDAPGASDVNGHEISDRFANGSVTTTELNVSLPVLLTT